MKAVKKAEPVVEEQEVKVVKFEDRERIDPLIPEVEMKEEEELSVIDEEPEYSEHGEAAEPEYDKTLFRPANEDGGFREAEISRISQEQAAIGNDQRWTKEEELADVPGYLERLYQDLEDLEGNQYVAKQLLERDLKTFIITDG